MTIISMSASYVRSAGSPADLPHDVVAGKGKPFAGGKQALSKLCSGTVLMSENLQNKGSWRAEDSAVDQSRNEPQADSARPDPTDTRSVVMEVTYEYQVSNLLPSPYKGRMKSSMVCPHGGHLCEEKHPGSGYMHCRLIWYEDICWTGSAWRSVGREEEHSLQEPSRIACQLTKSGNPPNRGGKKTSTYLRIVAGNGLTTGM